MKTKTSIVRLSGTLAVAVAFWLLETVSGTLRAQSTNAPGREKIGIYDSRAIAIAYTGSSAHEKVMRELKSEYDKAKSAGNNADMARLQSQGRAMQEKAHRQGFSTAPVDDLLLSITNALPQIKQSAGVTILVSKWDQAAMKKHPGAEQVDITMQLVDAFHPSERQRKYAIDIQKRDPIPLDKIGQFKD